MPKFKTWLTRCIGSPFCLKSKVITFGDFKRLFKSIIPGDELIIIAKRNYSYHH